jgi:hypothetical protein
MVLDYLQTTGLVSPEVEFKAEDYINMGYQRLTTFEVGNSGGFSLFGDSPADPMLTAYGLQEFNDMSRVHHVDPALISRTANWLLSHQNSDGSWEGKEGFHETTLTGQVARLPVTAFVVWGLLDAGFHDQSGAQSGIQYLREHQSHAEDAYVLSLVANALVAADTAERDDIQETTRVALDRLASLATVEGNSVYWNNESDTLMGSYGKAGRLETTALATLALLRANAHPDLANAALTYLVQNKDNFGTWETTQATVMSLKAMLESIRAGTENINATVTVSLNGSQSREIKVTPENFDVVQIINFDDVNIGRENIIEIDVEGEGNLMYQVTGNYYLPWEDLSKYPELVSPKDLVDIQVNYNRTELSVNDVITVDVTVILNEGQADSALIDLGIPPGFTVETADLAALVAYYQDTPEEYDFPIIERYELTGRQIIIYASNITSENALNFTYRLRAKFPLQAKTPASNVYDYYNPDVSGESIPLLLIIKNEE